MSWSPDLDNEINKKFVSDYKAKHGGYPSFYAAQAYDTILAVDHAIAKSGSKDTDKMRGRWLKAIFQQRVAVGNEQQPFSNPEFLPT